MQVHTGTVDITDVAVVLDNDDGTGRRIPLFAIDRWDVNTDGSVGLHYRGGATLLPAPDGDVSHDQLLQARLANLNT